MIKEPHMTQDKLLPPQFKRANTCRWNAMVVDEEWAKAAWDRLQLLEAGFHKSTVAIEIKKPNQTQQ